MPITTSISTPDMTTPSQPDTRSRPRNTTGVRARPTSAIDSGRSEGYWSWDGPSAGMTLRRNGDYVSEGLSMVGNKKPVDPQVTLPSLYRSPRLAPYTCQPPFPSPSPVRPTSPSPVHIDSSHTRVPFNTPIKPSTSSLMSSSTRSPSVDSSFDLSLVSDTSGESDASLSLSLPFDTRAQPNLDPFHIETFRPSINTDRAGDRMLVGLGITGLSNKDGGAFDGLGVVSVRSSAWRSSPSRFADIDEEEEEEESMTLSSTFMDETLFTLSADPFHTHVLTSISECPSEYETDSEAGAQRNSVTNMFSTNPGTSNPGATPSTTQAQRKLTRDPSAATISSHLKRLHNRSGVAEKGRRGSGPVWRV